MRHDHQSFEGSLDGSLLRRLTGGATRAMEDTLAAPAMPLLKTTIGW